MKSAVDYTKEILDKKKKEAEAALRREESNKNYEKNQKRSIIEYVLPFIDGYKHLGWNIEVWSDRIELTKQEQGSNRITKIDIRAKEHYNSWVNGGHDGTDYYIEWSFEHRVQSILYSEYIGMNSKKHCFAQEFGKFMADYC